MADLYRGEDKLLSRPVAIKIVRFGPADARLVTLFYADTVDRSTTILCRY